MTRLAAIALITLGAFLVLPQVFTIAPDQRLVVVGLILALVGGVGLADNPRKA